MKLAAKMILIVALAVSMILLIAFGYLAIRDRSRDLNDAYKSSEAAAKENAAIIKAELEVALDSARTLSQALSAFEEFPSGSRRQICSSILYKIAEGNERFLGAWACFEPDALDGMDSKYKDKEGYDETGRFIPYWTRGEAGITLSPLTDYSVEGAGDYYLKAFESGAETILEPYEYDINGQTVLLTTFSVPVKNSSGEVIGVVGIDISLDTLNQMDFNGGSYTSAETYLL